MRSLVALIAFFVLISGAAMAQDNTTDESTSNDTASNDTANEGMPQEDAPDIIATPPEVRFTVIAHADGAFYWTVEGQQGRNPTLVVPPGATVILTVRQAEGESTPHNMKVGDNKVSDVFSDPGSEIEYTFVAPESGDLVYICTIHGTAMSGTIKVRSAGGEAPPADDDAIKGATISLKSVAPDAPCDKQIPAIVTRDIVGAPTVADYVASCTATAGTGPAAPEPHAADRVLPISLGLIALGIAGVVWVHKYYKP